MESSIIYWCILYCSYVLLPVVPSLIIYRQFPDTSVGAKGILGGLKINATGAFAAYIITCLLGVFLVKKALLFIEDATNKNWTISAKIRFADEEGKELNLDAEQLENMTRLTNVAFNPADSGIKSSAKIESKASCVSDLPCVYYTKDGFIPTIIDLDTVTTGVNHLKRTIKLGTIYLKKSKNKYQLNESKDFVTTGPPIQIKN